MSVFIPTSIQMPPNVDITSNSVKVFKFPPDTLTQVYLGRVWGIVSLVTWTPTFPLGTTITNFYTLYFFSSTETGKSFSESDVDESFLSFSDSLNAYLLLITPPGVTTHTYLLVRNKHTTLPLYITLGLRQ
ncbi:MAG: hypothetical protein QW815_00480 [Nitrososphaerota archaeon]